MSRKAARHTIYIFVAYCCPNAVWVVSDSFSRNVDGMQSHWGHHLFFRTTTTINYHSWKGKDENMPILFFSIKKKSIPVIHFISKYNCDSRLKLEWMKKKTLLIHWRFASQRMNEIMERGEASRRNGGIHIQSHMYSQICDWLNPWTNISYV
jgi:hypothetical protein